MTPDEERRNYLVTALQAAGATLKDASLRLGRNHAYLQQHVRLGKPRYLPEQVREALVEYYGLDAARLKPPRVDMSRPVARPPSRETIKDPEEIALIASFRRLPPEERRAFLLLMRAGRMPGKLDDIA